MIASQTNHGIDDFLINTVVALILTRLVCQDRQTASSITGQPFADGFRAQSNAPAFFAYIASPTHFSQDLSFAGLAWMTVEKRVDDAVSPYRLSHIIVFGFRIGPPFMVSSP